jgi:hypothetical protein
MWCERLRPPSSGSGCSSARARTARTGMARTPTGRCPAWVSLLPISSSVIARRLRFIAVATGTRSGRAPVSGHVPLLRPVQPPQSARRITARQLLSHRAGLPNPIPVGVGAPRRSAASRPGPLPSWPACPPRLDAVRARPTGLVTQALARLCSRLQMATVAGRTFAELVHEEILGPWEWPLPRSPLS